MDKYEFEETIKKYIKQSGRSQAATARKLNYTPDQFHKWVKGINRMPDKAIQEFSELLNLTHQEQKELLKLAGYVGLAANLTKPATISEAALTEIKSEALDNFRNLSITIAAIENYPPTPFWDVRRANETELAYQDRAKNNYRDYQHNVDLYLGRLKVSSEVYKSYRRDVAQNGEATRRMTQTYDRFDEVGDSFERFKGGLHHILSLDQRDQERTEQALSLHQEMMSNAKVALAQAAAYFVLASADETDTAILSETLQISGIQVELQPGKEGHRAALQMADKYAQQKADILAKRLTGDNELKQIDPELSLMQAIREALKQPPTRLVDEILPYQNKPLDLDEQDPAKLFELAAFSFLEADGHAAVLYFQRAIELKTLNPTQEKFAQLSLDRLNQPEKYNHSLGAMIVKITPARSFAQAGLDIGDVLITLDGQTIQEPVEISSALGKIGQEPILLEFVRAGQRHRAIIKGGESAGAALTPLIVLDVIQL